MSNPIEVAVAVIQDESGRILLSKRPDHVHQGGLWEFPGGKLEAGESVAAALRREIKEELDLTVLQHEPLIRLTHHYSDKSVTLDVQRVRAFEGVARGLEGQPLEWVHIDDFSAYPLPAADHPIINAIKLPERYLITGGDPGDPDQFLQRLENSISSGVTLVQFRASQLDAAAYRRLAVQVIACCHTLGAEVLLNSEPGLAMELGADGVHLNSERLLTSECRPVMDGKWLAASCHSDVELRKAELIGVDFAVLSPVYTTRSHPEAEPLGWGVFEQWVGGVAMPVYALGGVGPGDLDRVKCAGGQGVAAISALWGVD